MTASLSNLIPPCFYYLTNLVSGAYAPVVLMPRGLDTVGSDPPLNIRRWSSFLQHADGSWLLCYVTLLKSCIMFNKQTAGKDVAPSQPKVGWGMGPRGGRHSPALALAQTMHPTKNDSCHLKIISFAFVTQL